METVSIRGMTPAVEQKRQLLPPVKLPKKAPLASEIEIIKVNKDNYLDIGIDEDLGIE